jgi:hypothetical protein
MLVVTGAASAQIGCYSEKTYSACCQVPPTTTTTTTKAASVTAYTYITGTLENVENSLSSPNKEHFTKEADVKKACDAQPKCSGYAKMGSMYFWLRPCGERKYKVGEGSVSLVKVKKVDGGSLKCECAKNLIVTGAEDKLSGYMGEYNFVAQPSQPGDKSGNRPIYKIKNTCSACGNVYLYYRIGSDWQGWLISGNGFRSTYAKLRNSNDHECPEQVDPSNWQLVTSAGNIGEDADMDHLVQQGSNPPKVPAPWQATNIKIVGKDSMSSTPVSPKGVCKSPSCAKWPEVQSKFDKCCQAALGNASAALMCSKDVVGFFATMTTTSTTRAPVTTARKFLGGDEGGRNSEGGETNQGGESSDGGRNSEGSSNSEGDEESEGSQNSEGNGNTIVVISEGSGNEASSVNAGVATSGCPVISRIAFGFCLAALAAMLLETVY